MARSGAGILEKKYLPRQGKSGIVDPAQMNHRPVEVLFQHSLDGQARGAQARAQGRIERIAVFFLQIGDDEA